ncbi:MAG: hypothetical protein KDA84_16055 [Planctomycetaceae bacterium]|nr:hypothetical protein [Planctomycetaceae bacterium]
MRRWLGSKNLVDGPRPGKKQQDDAKADGISERTLQRAKKKLGVDAGPDGFGGPWVWRLADSPTVRPESAHSAKDKCLADSDETGELRSDSSPELEDVEDEDWPY